MGSGIAAVANTLVERSSIVPIHSGVEHDFPHALSASPHFGCVHQQLADPFFACSLINDERLHHYFVRLFECWPFIGMHQSADRVSMFSHGGEVRGISEHSLYARC